MYSQKQSLDRSFRSFISPSLPPKLLLGSPKVAAKCLQVSLLQTAEREISTRRIPDLNQLEIKKERRRVPRVAGRRE